MAVKTGTLTFDCHGPLTRFLMAQEIRPDAIMRLGFGYWDSKTLLSAVELGLFTELAKGPLALDDIRARLNLHQRSVRDFLDALVAQGMLQREEGRYGNTPATDLYLDRASRQATECIAPLGGNGRPSAGQPCVIWCQLPIRAAHFFPALKPTRHGCRVAISAPLILRI